MIGGIVQSIYDRTVDEGDTLMIPVTITEPFCDDQVFVVSARESFPKPTNFATAGGEDTGDFQEFSMEVTIPAGATRVEMSVTTNDDVIDEAPEEAFAILAQWRPPEGTPASPIVIEHGTIIIEDNDVVAMSLTGGSAVEGEHVKFTISLVPASWRDVSMAVSTLDDEPVSAEGTGEGPGADYVDVIEHDVTIRAGELSAEVLVETLTDNDVAEGDETFRLTFQLGVDSRLRPDITPPDPDFAVGTIIDRLCFARADTDVDPPTIILEHTISVDEGEPTGDIPFTLSTPLCEDGHILWSNSDGSAVGTSATANPLGDYERVVGATLSIDASDTSGVISISQNLFDDLVDEEDETFTVTVNWRVGAGYMPPEFGDQPDQDVEVTIDDDDKSRVSVSDDTAAEGEDLEFRITLDPVNSRDVRVRYFTLDVTHPSGIARATEGVDYTPVDDDVIIRAGVGEAIVPVVTLFDKLEEGPESLGFFIQTPSYPNAAAADLPRRVGLVAYGTIVDNPCVEPTDPAHDLMRLVPRQATLDVDEDVDRFNGPIFDIVPRPCTFHADMVQVWAVPLDPVEATPDLDWIDAAPLALHDLDPSHGGGYGPNVAIIDDPIDEPPERFEIHVGFYYDDDRMPQHYRDVKHDADVLAATVTILDDDDPPSLSVASGAPAVEGAPVEFTVRLSGPSGRDITVDYETQQRLTGTRIATQGAACGAPDYPDYVRTAGTGAGAITFPVDPATTRTADLTPRTVSVPTCSDAEVNEGEETFLLRLLGPPDNATLSAEFATGTIRDDSCIQVGGEQDPAPPGVTLTFRNTVFDGRTARVPEYFSSLRYKVALDIPFCDPQTLEVNLVEGTARPSRIANSLRRVGASSEYYYDYVYDPDDPPSVSFGSRQLESSGRVRILGDRLDELDETFTLEFRWPDGMGTAYAEVEPISVPVVIVDDDTAVISVDPASADEGTPLGFTVSSHIPTTHDIDVTYSTVELVTGPTDERATGGACGTPPTADYEEATDLTVTIVADNTAGTFGNIRGGPTATIDVDTCNDVEDEDPERFLVELSDPVYANADTDDKPNLSVRGASAIGTIADGCFVASRRRRLGPQLAEAQHLPRPGDVHRTRDRVEHQVFHRADRPAVLRGAHIPGGRPRCLGNGAVAVPCDPRQ